jgi:uroporphyrinogen-III synthase
LELLENRHSREVIAGALNRILVLVRGPKTARVLDAYHVSAITVPEPFTSPMILRALDGHPGGFSLDGSRIAVQEYGRANDDLIQELSARGAQVLRVPVYRWALPEDTGPLRSLLEDIMKNKVHVIIFTSAVQADHIFQVAREGDFEDRLREALARAVVCSVGPTCSAAIRQHGVTVDVEPQQSKMGILIYESARIAPALLERKAAP